MAIVGLLAADLAVFGFLSFVSKGGHEVAGAQATAVRQVDHSQDAAAQSSLRNAMTGAKTLYMDNLTYEGLSAADLARIEPSLTYTDGPSTNLSTISVAFEADAVAMAALSPSGTCFTIKDDAATGVTFGSGTECTGQAALGAATVASW